MSLSQCLAVLTSVSSVILFAAFAQREVIEGDRASDGQAPQLPGKELLLISDRVAPAAVAGAVPQKSVRSRFRIALILGDLSTTR